MPSEAMKSLEKLAAEKSGEFFHVTELLARCVGLFSVLREEFQRLLGKDLDTVLAEANEMREEEQRRSVVVQNPGEEFIKTEMVIGVEIDEEIRALIPAEKLALNEFPNLNPKSAVDIYLFLRYMLIAVDHFVYIWISYDRVWQKEKKNLADHGMVEITLNDLPVQNNEFDEAVRFLQRGLMQFDVDLGVDQQWFEGLMRGVLSDDNEE